MIRKVKEEDAAEICGIYNPFVSESTVSFEERPVEVEEMKRRIREISEHCPYLVYEEAGSVMGYSYAHPWKIRAAYSTTMETTVYVSPEAEGRGVGTVLMKRMIEECRRMGVHSLIACITSDNERSIAFHEKLGFEAVSRFREVGRKFNRWLDVTDMELLL